MSATQPEPGATAATAAAAAPSRPVDPGARGGDRRPSRPARQDDRRADPAGEARATILHRQTDAAKARFADAATTPEGDLRVERVAAVVAVVAVVGGWLVYRRLRHG